MYNTYFLYTLMPVGHCCAGRWLHLTFVIEGTAFPQQAYESERSL